jgi:hypothetical protein
MPGLVETVESQRQASHEFPQPLGNLAKGRRDSHIPTAPTTRYKRTVKRLRREGEIIVVDREK